MKNLNLDERIDRLADLKRQREAIDNEIASLFATATVDAEPARRGRPRKDRHLDQAAVETNSAGVNSTPEQKISPVQ